MDKKIVNNPKKFWAKVRIRSDPNKCWPYKGTINKVSGYGTYGRAGKGLEVYAHRIAFLLSGGKLTKKRKFVLHHCDNPKCCNYEQHLYAGTQKQNMLDIKMRGHRKYWFGEQNGNAKLTNKEVRAIKKSNRSGASLARKFDVSQSTISTIRRGRMRVQG